MGGEVGGGVVLHRGIGDALGAGDDVVAGEVGDGDGVVDDLDVGEVGVVEDFAGVLVGGDGDLELRVAAVEFGEAGGEEEEVAVAAGS